MSFAWRPFVLQSETQRETVKESLIHKVSAWCSDWRLNSADPGTITVGAICADKSDFTGEWHVYGSSRDELHEVYVRQSWDPTLRAMAVLEPAHVEAMQNSPSDLAWGVVKRAHDDLVERCVSALTGGAPHRIRVCHSLPVSDFVRNGGFIVVTNTALCLEIVAQLPPRLFVPPRNSQGQAITPVGLAISNQLVRLTVTVGNAELTLNEIASLKPGDVVCLGTSLTDPIAVSAADGSVVAMARIGRLNTSLAISLSDPVIDSRK